MAVGEEECPNSQYAEDLTGHSSSGTPQLSRRENKEVLLLLPRAATAHDSVTTGVDTVSGGCPVAC